MTEIFRNRGDLEPREKPKQELADAYHPEHPFAKSVYGRSAYLEAQAKYNRELLTKYPHAILPHYPCG